jgi:hypothetical protein
MIIVAIVTIVAIVAIVTIVAIVAIVIYYLKIYQYLLQEGKCNSKTLSFLI